MPSPVFRDASYFTQTILGALIARAGITDVSDTSVGKVLSAATGNCLGDIAYACANLQSVFNIATAAGTDLDRRATDFPLSTLVRIPAQAAAVFLTFSRTTSGGAVVIPAGTSVKDAAGNVFSTTQGATLAAGSTQLAGIPASAQVPGSGGNVAAGSLTIFGSRPAGITAVTNPNPATGGAEAEEDAAFRQRIYTYVSGLSRGTPDALTSAVLGAQDPDTGDTILYANIEEDPYRPGRSVLYIADAAGTDEAVPTLVSGEQMTASRLGPPPGTAQGGEKRLPLAHKPVALAAGVTLVHSTRGTLAVGTDYTLDEASGIVTFAAALARGDQVVASYGYFTGVIALAQKIVDGDPKDRRNFPGIRAAGTQVVVAAPQILIEPITATLTRDPGYLASEVDAAVRAAIGGLVQGLPIGANLLLAALTEVVMQVPGVVNVTWTQPAADLLVAPGQLIRPPSDLSQIVLN